MSIDDLRVDATSMTPWQRHRFLAMIASVVVISLFLVSVALSVYNSSGAAQLDLSRPGYQDIRDKAKRDTTASSFSATGVLDKQSLDQFEKLYTERTGKVLSVDSFDAKPLSEDALQLLGTSNTAPDPAQ